MQELKCPPCRDNNEASLPRKPLTFKRRLRRAISPENLSLKARFLYAPGILLAIGSVTLFIVFVYYQGLIISESVNSRLGVFEQWVQDKINSQLDLLTSEVLPISTMPDVAQSMRERDRNRLKSIILPYMERLRAVTGQDNFYYHFHLPPAASFLRTWDLENTGADLSDIRPMVVKANKYMAPFRGAEIGPGGAVLRAIVPVSQRGEHLGTVEAASSIESLLQLSQLPSQFGVVLLLERRFADIVLPNHPLTQHGKWLVGRARHVADEPALYEELDSGRIPSRIAHTFFRFLHLDDFQGQPIGGLLLSYDSSTLAKSTVNEAVIFSLAFNMGAMTLMFMLYLNLKRVKQFLSRLRQILVETSNGNFGERFETEPVHCLEVLHCGKRECPVYENPALICYMETGDQAISPVHRGSCAFLKQYRKCEACPVHALRHGDELVEMRNAVNTMMRIWGSFATRVNQVVAGVLHSRESAEHTPSLTHISATLEHMAGLTAFTHDLQGVISKAEVFAMLDGVFTGNFGLTRYAILEIDQAGKQMDASADKLGDPAILCVEVFGAPDMCRAKRMAEEVSSAENRALCPYFHIDHEKLVRCCLPLVMGGRVGGVISFVFPRAEWEKRRVSLSIIQKYLSESAPVLSTMQLLQISKENANRDALTGAHNRRFLDEYIGKYEAVAVRDGRMVGFIMADMDFFKQINDQFGHIAGDAVLKDLSALIAHQVRKADLVVRYGGEEFLVLLHEVRTGYTAEVAEKIRHAVESHVFELPGGRTVRKTISLGAAEFPADADMFHKAIKCADMALYKAKAAGRNRVEKYEPHMWTETAQ